MEVAFIVRVKFVPFSPPLIGEEEIAEVVDTLRSDWITTGPKVKAFEQQFMEFLGAPAAFAVSSCTAALHLALLALEIGPGDAVITTPMTFCSGVHVIEHVGARPVMVDVEPDTLNLDPKAIEAAIQLATRTLGLRVKAILLVHLYGHPCDLAPILEIAARHGLAVIEDAAHSLPARYDGKLIGSLSSHGGVPVLTCFSFYATKNLTTAEGGMLVGPPELIERARNWGLHGMNRDAWKRYGKDGSWFYEVVCPGFKYNLTDIQAALGIHQLRKLPQFHARRQAIVRQYNAAFRKFEELQAPAERSGVEHAWHVYALRLKLDRIAISRNQFISEMQQRNIACSVHFIPIHLHRYYREKYGYAAEDFPVSYREYQRLVSLPLSPRMTNEDVDAVIAAVTEIVQAQRGNRKVPKELPAAAAVNRL
jgi:dTDP-4-amino-4,6-dideoxygalactose transaminase